MNNTNKLSDTLKTMLAEGKTAAPEYAELKRRFGFEFDGMRLHEYYFSNLGKSAPLSNTGKLYQALSAEFGSYQLWETDFKATASMRGIGWVILYKDSQTGRLFNQWINEHETGHLAGITPILVIDIFEHAFMTDYGLKRADYIAAFLKNINWDEAEKRFQN
nr:Fe-Mn family superoxide dismutase [Dehalococcoides mccartyi]